jgi:capsular exopolysaccharide synthesis family protein
VSSAEKRPAPASRTVIEHPPATERVPAPPSAPRKTNVPPPGVAASPDLPALLGALRRRWLLALSLALTLACGVTAALWYFLPARYTAYSYVRVMLRPDFFWDKGEGGRDFLAVLKREAFNIKSKEVLLSALGKDYKIRNLPLFSQMPDPHSRMTFLDENLKIEFAETSELITTTFLWEDPDVAVKVVDAVTDAYVKRAQKEEEVKRKKRAEQMEGIYNTAKLKLGEKYSKLATLAKDGAGPDPSEAAEQRVFRAQELQEVRKQYNEDVRELDRRKQRLANLEDKRQNLDSYLEPALLDGEVRAVVKEMEDHVAKQQMAVTDMVNKGYRQDESILVKARRSLAEMKKALDRRKEEVRSALLQSQRKKLEFDLVQEINHHREEIPPLEKRATEFKKRADELAKETISSRIVTSDAEVLRKEIQADEETLKDLTSKLKVVKAEVNAEPRVSVEQEATWQDKDLKRRILMLAGGFLGTFFLAALGVSYVEFRARKIHSAREVMVGLNMKVLGEVPDWPQAGLDRFIGPDEGPPSPAKPSLIEAIDGIRTLLLRAAGEQASPVVMVTSAVEGEGKTTLASNLALSVARSGRKTLFIDCDLRRPVAHQLFEQTLQPGFSELVLGEVDLGGAMRPTTTEQNLWLLPAGQWDRAVVQELARNGGQDLFAQLRAEFDFIILDSHPLLPATDSLLIGQHVDGVIISVLHDVSQTPKVYAACQRLETLGIPCFGAVVNGTASSY